VRHEVRYGHSAYHGIHDCVFPTQKEAVEFAERIQKQYRYIWLSGMGRVQAPPAIGSTPGLIIGGRLRLPKLIGEHALTPGGASRPEGGIGSGIALYCTLGDSLI
jgi:hypothetical protein